MRVSGSDGHGSGDPSDDARPQVAVVYGTRPEVIKMSPVVRALEERSHQVRLRKIFSGQHRELAADLFAALGMEPDVDLEVMDEGQTLEAVGARCLEGFAGVFGGEPPDCVLVQGDTSTVYFAALAAYFHRLPVGHVEAGLRSHDKFAPFPEEMMRRMTDTLTDFHFAPTPRAAENLAAEGIGGDDVFVTGNTVVDAVRLAARQADRHVNRELRRWTTRHRRFVVVTLHRRESFDGALGRILRAVRAFAASHPDVRFIYPVHPNPSVREPAESILRGCERVDLVDPLPYLDMVYLLSRCTTILTDSGGLQEEGPALGKRVLVAREGTERPEGVEAGVAELVGSNPERITAALERELAADRSEVAGAGATPYGDGRAGRRIADVVASRLTGGSRRTSDWRPGKERMVAGL